MTLNPIFDALKILQHITTYSSFYFRILLLKKKKKRAQTVYFNFILRELNDRIHQLILCLY